MDPKKWGASGWRFILSIVLGYTDSPKQKDILSILMFFESLEALLPCGICRSNYAEFIKQNELTEEIAGNKTKLLRWTMNLYNNELRRHGKPTMTVQEIVDIYG